MCMCGGLRLGGSRVESVVDFFGGVGYGAPRDADLDEATGPRTREETGGF